MPMRAPTRRFELLARRMLGTRAATSSTSRAFGVNVERRLDAKGELKTVAEAVVKVDVDGDELHVGRRKATARSTRSTSRSARTSASSAA